MIKTSKINILHYGNKNISKLYTIISINKTKIITSSCKQFQAFKAN